MEKEDKIFLAYEGKLGEEMEYKTKKRISWILNGVGVGQNILDIGCSQGIISILAAEKGNYVTGLDINQNNIEFAQNLLSESYSQLSEKVTFMCADFYKWEQEKRYHVILITEVLEHLKESDIFLRNVTNFLEEDGKLIITVPFGVLNHPDHYTTFYMTNLYHLISEFFDIEKMEFVEQFIGVVAYKKGVLAKNFQIDEESIQCEEEKFYEVDKRQTEKIEKYYAQIAEQSEKYKSALKNYETAKQWHKNSLDKNEKLEKEIEKVKIGYGEIEHRFKLKEEECNVKEVVTKELSELNSQRKMLLSEYLDWNEKNKEKIEELQSYLVVKDKENEQLKKDFQAVTLENSKLENEIELERGKQKANIEELQLKYEKLEQFAKKEKQELQEQITYEKELRNNYKENLSFCKKENEENKEKIEELQKYLLEEEKQREDLKKTLDALSLEKQNLEKIIELEKEEKKLGITELQLKYEDLQQLTQREKESLREQISYEKGLKNSYKEDLIFCAEENRGYKAKLINLQNDLEEKESKNAELQLAYESLQGLSEKEKEELKEQIIHEKELHGLCKKELICYINELEEKEEVLNLLKQYKEEIEILEKKIEEDTIKNNGYKEDLIFCKEENREYKAKLINLQNNLEEKESENAQLEQSFYNATLEKQELAKLLELAKEELKEQITYEKELYSLCEKELVYYINELEEKEEVLNLLKQYKEEIERLEKQIKEDTIIKYQLIEELLLCTTTLQGQEDFLQELRQYIRKMETQNNYLISENAEYRRKLSLITDTKLGQLGIKIYHILKKIKSWFFKRK